MTSDTPNPPYDSDRPDPVGPTDAARNPPASVGSVGVPGRGTEPPFDFPRPSSYRVCWTLGPKGLPCTLRRGHADEHRACSDDDFALDRWGGDDE